MRRVVCFVIVCCFLIFHNVPFFCSAVSSRITTKDDIVQEYTNKVIPQNAILVDSHCQVQYRTSSGKSQIHNKNMPVVAESYTYCLSSDTEDTYYTIIVIEVTKKIRISKNDCLEVGINDFLRNYSPEDGIVFSRNSLCSEWSNMRNITPIPTGITPTNTISIFGSEIENRDPYTLILLSFPSQENPNTDKLMPEYAITFLHDDRTNIPIYIAIAGIVICLIGIAINLYKKRIKRDK